MLKSLPAMILAAVVCLDGCGSPQLSSQVTKGAHDGTSFRLPDEKGLVEIVNEPTVTDRRNPQPTSIVAYFLQADGKSALNPGPTEVSFTIDPDARSRQREKPAASPTTLLLTAEPKADDAGGASRFASKTGPFDLSSLRGTLKAKINGQDVSISLMEAR
jgi:hypothetical protein